MKLMTKSLNKSIHAAALEFKQSFTYWFFLILICFLTGFSIDQAQISLTKVFDLIHIEPWQADLVILPKGISLEDFRKELLSGKTKAFIPEILYQTTLGLSQNLFQLQAVLPIESSSGVTILNEGPQFGTKWLPGSIRLVDWNEDLISVSHSVWQKKLLAGIFAKGDLEQMQKLKDLIDQRTVAQAFFIQDEQQKAAIVSDQIARELYTFVGILVGLITVGCSLVYLLLKNRLQQLLFVFKENGMAGLKIYFVIIFIFFTIFFPAIFGYLLANVVIS